MVGPGAGTASGAGICGNAAVASGEPGQKATKARTRRGITGLGLFMGANFGPPFLGGKRLFEGLPSVGLAKEGLIAGTAGGPFLTAQLAET